MRIRLLFIFLLIIVRNVFAAVPIEDLSNSWLVFDASYKAYVPYIPAGESPKILYYSLKPKKFQQDTLQFMSDKGICVYADYRLIYQNTESGTRLIKIPIQKLASIATSDSVLLAFYREDGIKVNSLAAFIATQGLAKENSAKANRGFLNILPRHLGSWSTVLVLVILVVIIMLVINKAIFPEGVSFGKLIGSMNAGSAGPLNGLLWAKIIINSVCFATFVYFIQTSAAANQVSSPSSQLAIPENDISFSVIFFWAFSVHILKFGYNYCCANFSNMTHLLQSQNFMFVNLFYVLNLSLLSLLVLSNISVKMENWLLSFSSQIGVLYFVVPIFVLIVNIIKLSGLRNVYLFSYICTAELLPLILALKFLA